MENLKNSSFIAFGFLSSMFVCAKESLGTPPVVGYMPIINSINYVSTGIPNVGTDVTITYTYYDQDNDPEGATDITWSNKKKGKTVRIELSDAGAVLTPTITPYSNPPADPVVGIPVSGPATPVIPLPTSIPRFILPVVNGAVVKTAVSYSAAQLACSNPINGVPVRLPTVSELSELYKTLQTVAPRFSYPRSPRIDYFVGHYFGWPSLNILGGTVDHYWTDGGNSAVDIQTGAVVNAPPQGQLKHFVCYAL